MSLIFKACRPQSGVMTTVPPRMGNYSLKRFVKLWIIYTTSGAFCQGGPENIFLQLLDKRILIWYNLIVINVIS